MLNCQGGKKRKINHRKIKSFIFYRKKKSKLSLSEQLDELMRKPHYQWSAEDKKLMETVREYAG